jgi:hypothetical protein
MRPDPEHKPGPCRPLPLPFPSSPYTWPLHIQGRADGWGGCMAVEVPAVLVAPVWEPVALGKETAVPTYDACFQGF